MAGRTYRYMKESPLYPFGHGLSYSTFNYGQAKLPATQIKAGEGLTITIPVTNASNRKGEEVVQVYIKRNNDPQAPVKSLRAFQRTVIEQGQTQDVELTIQPDAFAFYDDMADDLKVKTGSYTILYGGTSADSGLKSVDVTVIP